jgi:hypothetical protein
VASRVQRARDEYVRLARELEEARRELVEALAQDEEQTRREREALASDPLRNTHGPRKVIATMDTGSAPAPAPVGKFRARGTRLKSRHIGAVRIKAVDGSIGAFATKYKLKPQTVRSWYATGEAARRIPRSWQKHLSAAPYLIPESAWRNGVTDDE